MADITISDAADSEDNFSRDSQPTTNHGTLDQMQMGHLSGNDSNSAIRIATDALPDMASSTLFRGDFTLHSTIENDTTNDVEAYRLLQPWVESEMTWNEYSSGNSWNTAGALGDGTDYASDASPPTLTPPASYTAGDPISFTFDAEWPAGWKNGDYANEGLIVHPTSTGTTNLVNPRTTEHATVDDRPSYYIEYVENGGGRLFPWGAAIATRRRNNGRVT